MICGIIESFIVGTMMQVARYLRSSSRWISEGAVVEVARVVLIGVGAPVALLLLSPELDATVAGRDPDTGTIFGSTTDQSLSPYRIVLTL
jgi:hypothetical protein